MKKALTLALAALAVSALQAITWTDYGIVSGNQNIDTGLNIGAGQSGTLVLIFTASSLSSSGHILMFGAQAEGATTSSATGDATRARIVLYSGSSITGNTYARIDADGASGTLVSSTYAGWLATGSESIVAVSIARGAEVGDTTTVTLYVSGSTTTLTFEETEATLAYSYQIASLGQNYGGSATNNLDFEVLTADTAATVDEIRLLPEPTVLALLALGVAGMALKRKVA